tara:strand:+ start:2537 stop:3211 length:675 start_codon:yes stop_codon:yes gene_type:complete
MKLEYKVQELKHKLQKYLIEDKKEYDRTVKESGAEESKEIYLEDIKRKRKIIDDWRESVEEEDLLKSFTKLEPKSRIEEGWFFDTEVVEDKLVPRNISEFPQLPEGFYWKLDYRSSFLIRDYSLSPYYVRQPVENIPSKIKVFEEFNIKTLAIKNGYTFEDCSYLTHYEVFEICGITIPYIEISEYTEPSNVRELLDKIILAEKHGCVKVTLEDKDLGVLMDIE